MSRQGKSSATLRLLPRSATRRLLHPNIPGAPPRLTETTPIVIHMHSRCRRRRANPEMSDFKPASQAPSPAPHCSRGEVRKWCLQGHCTFTCHLIPTSCRSYSYFHQTLKDPSKFVVTAVPVAVETGAGPAAAKEEAKVEDTKEESEDEDMGFSLFEASRQQFTKEDEATAGSQTTVHGGTITVHERRIQPGS